MVFMALARFANLSVVFDPAFRDVSITVDLRKNSLEDALTSLTASTHTFYRVTAQRTVTIVPDTPAKRREYEESVVRTFYLSNADIKEVIDLLRVVVDVRQISPITATNAISLKDTPERIAAAAQLISAVDKARPEVVIDVELLEVESNETRGVRHAIGERRFTGRRRLRSAPGRSHVGNAHQSDASGCIAGRLSSARLPTPQNRPEYARPRESPYPNFGRARRPSTIRRASAGTARPSLRRSRPAASTSSRSHRLPTRTSA